MAKKSAFENLMGALGVRLHGPAPTNEKPTARVGNYAGPVGKQDSVMTKTMQGYEDQPDTVRRVPTRPSVTFNEIRDAVRRTAIGLRHPK